MRDFPGSVIREHHGKSPDIHPSAFIAPRACLIGDVTVGAHASVWYNCVLRADLAPIVIGARSNIQDGTVIHVEGPRKGRSGTRLPTIVGEDALVGHMAVLHGCRISDRGFVGMGSIVMDGAQVGPEAMLAAGALLPPHKAIPARELWTGRPAKLARMLRDSELAAMRDQVAHYLELAESHS